MGMAKKAENAHVTLALSQAEQRKLKALSREYMVKRVEALLRDGEYSQPEIARIVGRALNFVQVVAKAVRERDA